MPQPSGNTTTTPTPGQRSTQPAPRQLQAFKAPRATADAEDPCAAIVVGTDGFVWLEDRDGLIPGMRTRYPHLELSTSFPDVGAALAGAAGQAMSGGHARALIVDAKPARLFAHAAIAYGRPLTFEPLGGDRRGWFVWCGPRFAGVISSEDPGGDSLARRQSERHEHLERLGLARRDPAARAARELGAGIDLRDGAGVDEDLDDDVPGDVDEHGLRVVR